MVSEGLHVANNEIWCQKKGYVLQIMKMVSEEGLHAAGDDIWCQKEYMRQMMKNGIRRITCCR